MIEAYNIAVLSGLAAMLMLVLVNVFAFRRLPAARESSDALPSLSVVIPARNEEHSIGRCLASLSAQKYPGLEIIVLDDCSTDRTRDIVLENGQKDPRIRYMHGRPLPAGWRGKSHACFQAAAVARGDLLLFTDADTVYQPGALVRLSEASARSGAALLTLVPEQRMESFWERTFMPLLHYVAMCFLPIPLVPRRNDPSLAMANGQCMLFRRDAYDQIGGHASVRGAVVEDVWLARAVKRAGLRLVAADGSGVVSCRMYTSLREIVEGFTKNLHPGLNSSLLLSGGVLLWSLASGVAPVLWLAGALVAGAAASPIVMLLGAQCALMLAIRLVLAARFRMSAVHALLHPLAMGLMCFILIRSIVRYRFGGGAVWKGRTMSLTPDTQ